MDLAALCVKLSIMSKKHLIEQYAKIFGSVLKKITFLVFVKTLTTRQYSGSSSLGKQCGTE